MEHNAMSQKKPMNRGCVEKRMSFTRFQGIPRMSDSRSMSSKQNVKRASSDDHGDVADRSRMGKDISSSNSSILPSGMSDPRYHLRPPSTSKPPFLTIMAAHDSRSRSLYALRCSRRIRMNKWSSTHLDIGPIPCDQKMSAPASAIPQ